MWKLMCLLGLLLSGLVARSQVSPNPIELARTAAQVQRIVRATDEYYRDFVVDSSLTFEDKRVERVYRRAGIKAWEKADIDGDGRLNLLITGSHHGRSKVLCLLNATDDKPFVKIFRRERPRYCPIANVVRQDGRTLIRYTDFYKPFYDLQKLRGRKSFLLIYKFDGFVEYNRPAPRPAVFDSLVYESSFYYHEAEEERLTLAATGKASYHAVRYPIGEKENKTFVAQKAAVGVPSLAPIRTLAGELANQRLRPVYRIGSNHIPHTYLTIYYQGGRRLTVNDEGGMGTFSLTRFFELLRQLRRTETWQDVKP